MIDLTISLQDIPLDPGDSRDLTILPPQEAAEAVRALYEGIAGPVEVAVEGDTAHIRIAHQPFRPADDTNRLYRRAVRHAETGAYDRAIPLFETTCREMPMLPEARRNLGMAYLEVGRVDNAKRTLMQAVRLYPEDAWGYLLLGNLYAKQERNLPLAQHYYDLALARDPGDPFALASSGAVAVQRGDIAGARALFERALEAPQPYPNAYYGLALLERNAGNLARAREVLDALFDAELIDDPRYQAVYAEAQGLYLDLCRRESEEDHERLMALARERAEETEELVGLPIVLREDPTLESVQAVAESAWRHHRDEHVIRYAADQGPVLPHLIAHELEHLRLDAEARAAGTNRLFVSSARTREHALRSLERDITRLSRMGYPDEAIAATMQELVEGLARQLYNTPLDMVVEYRIFQALPELRPNQLLSLHVTNARALEAVTNPEIQRLTPRFVHDASSALNAAYALFIDELYGGRTNHASAYSGRPAYVAGRLLEIWRGAMADYRAGAELDLVDRFAEVLKLREWFAWQEDPTMPAEPQDVEEAPPAGGQSVTNPELLRDKEPATVMYMLSALQRFEKMRPDEVFAVAAEAALQGQGGLDYASPEKKYRLQAFPGERFSGLQMMCFMYVGFQQHDPSVDLGMDLDDAYRAALALHREEQ